MIELRIQPSGRLHCVVGKKPEAKEKTNPTATSIATAFSRSADEGLFSLASLEEHLALPPILRYWTSFSRNYLSDRCMLPDMDSKTLNPLGRLADKTIHALLISLPPMEGAEYLSLESLQGLRTSLDTWVCQEVSSAGNLAAFLAEKAPHWHRQGRVCFHLAEVKNDPSYPFAFMATYAPETKRQSEVRHKPLIKALEQYAGENKKKQLIQLLAPIQLASESSSMIKDLVESGDIYHPMAWDPREAYEFLTEAKKYEEAGIIVKVPNWWKKRPRPSVSVTIDSGSGKFSADSLLDFKLNVVLGDQHLSKQELAELMTASNGLALIRGQWIEVDNDKLSEALAHWKHVEADVAEGGLSFAQGMRLLAGAPINLGDKIQDNTCEEWAFVQPGKRLSSLLDDLRSPNQIKNQKLGKTLKATLRPYQENGVSWLWLLSQMRLGACLADDMGLGKTMQIIALLLLLKQQQNCNNSSLLLLPASLLANWKTELKNFAPSLTCIYLHSSQLSKKEISDLAKNSASLTGVDLVLTTYGTIGRHPWLQDKQWEFLILDEAQAIKNPAAQQTKTVKRLKSASRIALTGTPVENRLSDLWSLFDFLNPGLLGSQVRFKKFIKSLAQRDKEQYAPLRKLVSPYILRRLKTDRSVIKDLPDKTEIVTYCSLSKIQASIYQAAVSELATLIANTDGIKRRGLILSYLLKFKQICNHPSQFLGDQEYTPQESGKFERLAVLCEEIASRQEKLLVFTQYRTLTKPLAIFLAGIFGREGLTLHGGTPVKRRQKMVEQFQEDAGPPFFVLSLKAGGTGLNLTQASHVVHFDRWWNPAVENQATDRAYRIGQKRNVLVHKFVCQGTLEEQLDDMIEEKKSLADNIINQGAEAMLTEMDTKSLIKLVSLDIEKTRV